MYVPSPTAETLRASKHESGVVAYLQAHLRYGVETIRAYPLRTHVARPVPDVQVLRQGAVATRSDLAFLSPPDRLPQFQRAAQHRHAEHASGHRTPGVGAESPVPV